MRPAVLLRVDPDGDRDRRRASGAVAFVHSLDVSTRAERAACAGEDDAADIGRGLGLVQGECEPGDHLAGEGIPALRPVHRQDRDPVLDAGVQVVGSRLDRTALRHAAFSFSRQYTPAAGTGC